MNKRGVSNQAASIRFMRAFAGIVLRIPSMPAVERLGKDHQNAAALSTDPTTETVRRRPAHSVSMRAIAKSFSKSTGRGLKNVRLKRTCCKR